VRGARLPFAAVRRKRNRGRKKEGGRGERKRDNNGDERALSRAKRVTAAGNSASREVASQLRAQDDSAKSIVSLSLSRAHARASFFSGVGSTRGVR